MKILEESELRIVLKDSNWGGLIFGIVITLGSLFFAYQSNPFAKEFDIKTLIFPGIFLLVGLLLLFTSKITTITLDKNINKIEFIKKGILGVSSKNYPLNQIIKVDLREQIIVTRTNNNNRGFNAGTPRLQFQTVLVLRDGAEIPLGRLKSPATASIGGAVIMSGVGTEQVIGQKIATFLGVPFEKNSPMGGAMPPSIQPPISIPPII